MTKLIFRPLKVEDKAIYQHYYTLAHSQLTDLTFSCRMAWNQAFQTEVAYYEDCCILISNGSIFTDPHALMPLGQLTTEKLDKIWLALTEEFHLRGWKLKVMCVDPQYVALLESSEKFQIELNYNADNSDYIYLAKNLRTLSGNHLHQKRNHLNKFKRQFPDYVYQKLEKSHAQAALNLVEEWCKDRNIDPHSIEQSDYLMIKHLFLHFDQLDLLGGAIFIAGQLKAFSIGSLGYANTACIHFEKADPSISGIYSAINQLVLENEFPTAEFVNREEDLGIEGLRKSKQSYNPSYLTHKYKGWIQEKKEK